MEELKKKLQELQKRGYEQVTINDVLQWMYQIKQDAFIKRNKLDD